MNLRISVALLSISLPFAAIAQSGVETTALDQAVKAEAACLGAMDQKARQKKLSAETYKIALEGACLDEHRRTVEAFGAYFDASVDARVGGTSLAEDPSWEIEKAKTLKNADTIFEKSKAELLSKYVMD